MSVSTAALVVGLMGALSSGLHGVNGAKGAGSDEAPDFGPNVLIVDPSMPSVQERLNAIFAEQEKGQFNANRHAILFKPGKYDLDVQVGFYTQVLGLGRSPDDVAITGAVRSKAGWMRNRNATCNFWRSVENLSVTPTVEGKANVWAVSQATWLRRVRVKGDLHLWDGGWSSGGFLADCVIDGKVDSGSQQQWMSRNAEWGSWQGGNWNMVFVGTTRPPTGTWQEKAYTVIEKTPIVREKPYLFVDEGGKYAVMVPELDGKGTQGTTWNGKAGSGTPMPIDRFFLARPERDTSASINAALEAGKSLILTPGIYHLEGSIRVTRPGTVVLGLGFATLVPDKGTPAMEIADVDGVTVGGIIFDAGPVASPVLVRVGEAGSRKSHAGDPTFLYDITCRVGGASVGMAETLMTIESANVVGDNLWLWRADHGAGAAWNVNRNRNGLIVNGADVTMYGLFVEHTQEYQTIWNGEGGRVYFYQSEMPYDPPSQEAWSHQGVGGGVRGYASYKVGASVRTHEAWGLGVYCVFRGAAVIADSAFEAPATPGVRLRHMITVRLEGLAGSGIEHVLNDQGASVITSKVAKLE